MDDKDIRIQQLERENALLKQTVANLTAKLNVMESKIAVLEAKIARLTRDSSTSSKPPSSDIVTPPPLGMSGKQQKRSPGGQPGHTRHERAAFPPERVDRVRKYVTVHGFPEFLEMARLPQRLVVYRAPWTTRTFGFNNWSARMRS